MSCNGCRVLRKGCTENCILRQCLQGIESPQAQANATVFVAKFFGRAGLMSFISSVPESQRPALFQSLLFEACGRTVNPVTGAVGLLSTRNWHLCQSAVETVLRGGTLRPITEFIGGGPIPDSDDASESDSVDLFRPRRDPDLRSKAAKRNNSDDLPQLQRTDLDLNLNLNLGLDLHLRNSLPARMAVVGRVNRRTEKRRKATPSHNSEESETTTSDSGSVYHHGVQGETKLLRFF